PQELLGRPLSTRDVIIPLLDLGIVCTRILQPDLTPDGHRFAHGYEKDVACTLRLLHRHELLDVRHQRTQGLLKRIIRMSSLQTCRASSGANDRQEVVEESRSSGERHVDYPPAVAGTAGALRA